MSARDTLRKHFGTLGIVAGDLPGPTDDRPVEEEDTPEEILEGGDDEITDDLSAEEEPEGEETEEEPAEEETPSQEGMSPEEKAKLLDRLLTDPTFRKAFMAGMDGEGQNAQQEQGGDALTFNPFEGVNPSDVLEEEALPAVKAVVWNVLQEYLFPELQQYKQVIVQLAQGHQASRFEGLEKKYPDAASKRQEIAALVQANPNLSLEQAYFAVAGPSAVTKPPAPKRKKKVSLTKAGSVSSKKARPRQGGPRTMAEIVREEFEKAGLR